MQDGTQNVRCEPLEKRPLLGGSALQANPSLHPPRSPPIYLLFSPMDRDLHVVDAYVEVLDAEALQELHACVGSPRFKGGGGQNEAIRVPREGQKGRRLGVFPKF